ncbi:MAG: hypothetical protein FWG70_05485 [Oscillospiraceae bacterium]|nr:hypothetical protein [Oscillospiraceae bacterium]
MTGTQAVRNYINSINANTPIFVDEVKAKVASKGFVGNNAKLILSRLESDGLIARYERGIYYKPEKTIWGTSTLGSDVVLRHKYLQDGDGRIKGYVTGARLFNHIGLTTLVPRRTEIVTNEHLSKNKTVKYGAVIQRAKLPVNNENYLYQQIIDVIENKENIEVESELLGKRMKAFFNDNQLDFATLYKTGLERKMGQRNLKKMARCVLGN